MKENSHQATPEIYRETAREVLGDSVQYTMNSDSSFVLCQHITRTAEPPQQQRVSYCVINMDTHQIVYQAHVANGLVKWYSKKELQIRNLKAFPTVRQEGIFIYNLETKKRTNISAYQSQRE